MSWIYDFSWIKQSEVDASGTVFNQALIWKPVPENFLKLLGPELNDKIDEKEEKEENLSNDQTSMLAPNQPIPVFSCMRNVLHTLSGHDGVIFGIRFSNNGLTITTTSDDRTIRVWSFSSLSDMYSKKKCSIYQHVLFGHKARIWDCLVFDDFLVSISEDSTCRIWKLSPENEYKTVGNFRNGHSGKNIWSVAVDAKNGLVITGGEDGGIRNWSINSISDRQIGRISSNVN
ncbi:putative WD repeat-containing protein [Smittium culicis]|uniref:Putative WD repeat-containing protein n=1 Tax=Smittium culicis TaxID=133412 RepID=A0A1R1X388_9FUNG|nr:putative WD repeat-containing protein [Smittium culicis]